MKVIQLKIIMANNDLSNKIEYYFEHRLMHQYWLNLTQRPK